MKTTMFCSILWLICLSTMGCNGRSDTAKERVTAETPQKEVKPVQQFGSDIWQDTKGVFDECVNGDGSIRIVRISNGDVTIQVDSQKVASQAPYPVVADHIDGDLISVEGMDDGCTGLFVGDIGQDINPVLCMLRKDGGVEILSLFQATAHHDFCSSGRIEGLDNIVAFRNGGGGEYVENGKTLYTYVTIYAIDKQGASHEIKLFNKGGEQICRINNGKVSRLTLTPDWKMRYALYSGRDNPIEEFSGRFREQSYNEKDETFVLTYNIPHFTDLMDPTHPQSASVNEKGSFSLLIWDNSDWVVDCKEGGLIFSGTYSHE